MTFTLESMQHTDKKVLLLGIREELYKPFPAVMTYHSKAGCPVRCANICFDLDEAPVHLIALAWIGLISASAVVMLRNKRPSGRHKKKMILDVSFYLGTTSGITDVLKLIRYGF